MAQRDERQRDEKACDERAELALLRPGHDIVVRVPDKDSVDGHDEHDSDEPSSETLNPCS